ncbi:MAG: hypothetical protein M1820_008514 [Bogoriella megaspora]|nr:MAG: hypothetical protein M1820_008514 [Bogoriella megaspora]
MTEQFINKPDSNAALTNIQAGGGVSAVVDKSNETKVFSPAVLEYFKKIYADIGSQESLALHKEILAQRSQARDSSPTVEFEDLLKYFSSTESNALVPLKSQDLSLPLSNYFISSSHNTYLSGNQLYGTATTDAYKNVLLRGCRCVEIDIWDGEPMSDHEKDNESEEGKHGIRGRIQEGFSKIRKKSPAKPQRQESTLDSPAAELDVPKPWRSQSGRAEPRVLHGHTATKEVSFRDVCKAIRKYAFRNSDLPIIVSLEVHTSPEQQETMVEIMEEHWKDLLVRFPKHQEDLPEDIQLPSPGELHNKILVKVKYSPKPPPTKTADVSEKLSKHVRNISLGSTKNETNSLHPSSTHSSTSSSSSTSDAEPSSPKKQKAPKQKGVLPALSRLGIYTRAYHFSSLTAPTASIPTHVFALSETRLLDLAIHSPSPLFLHNKSFLMRAYPKGTRLDSSNLDPSVFWRKGVQIVALNWQKWDEGMMLNEGMFGGSGGWVAKPVDYRSSLTAPTATDVAALDGHGTGKPREMGAKHQSEVSNRGTVDLVVTLLAAQNIPLPEDKKEIRPFVKIELHVEKEEERKDQPIPGGGKSKDGEYKLRTKVFKGRDIDFGSEVLRFEGVRGVVPELSFVRFKVMDQEVLGSDLASWACFRLDRLKEGYRFIHLYDDHGMPSEGVLLVKIQYRFSTDDVLLRKPAEETGKSSETKVVHEG